MPPQKLWGQYPWRNKQENGNTYTPRVFNQTVLMGNSSFLRFANWKNGSNTSLHWDACPNTPTSYDTYLTIFNSASAVVNTTNGVVAFNDDNGGTGGDNACGGGTQASLTWAANTNNTLYAQLNRYNYTDWTNTITGSATLNYRCIPPNTPSLGTAGSGTWNIYCFDSGDAAGNNNAWSPTFYAGYYTENTLNFDTQTRWSSGGSPYDANATNGNAYVGCFIPADNHSWSAVRTNISCGTYQLQVTHDDIGQIFINGVSVYNNASCCASTNAGTFVITPSDVITYRVSEGGGGSNGLISFNSTAALSAGTITYGGATDACASYDPPIFGSSAAASGGSSAAITGNNGQGVGTSTYQWQVNGGDIGGATGLTYDPPALGVGSYTYRRRVTDRCGNTAFTNTFTINVTAQPVAPTLNVKTPNVAGICQGQGVNATINAGSGGGSGAADTYEYSINGGGSWLSYTSGSNIATSSASGSVQVRVSRSAGTGTGCAAVGPNVIATWTVSPQIVAPTLNTKTPNVTDICQGQAVNATINAGSGGTGATDTYEYTINGGTSWLSYTSGTSIATGSATGSVQVRVSRSAGTGSGCTATGPTVIATWNVSPQIVAPTLNTKTPNVTDICQGQAVSATINAGSGGTGATDTYEYTINGGTSWLSYTSGTSIATGSATGSVQVRVSRSAGTGSGCTATGPTVIATWNVSPQIALPTLNTQTPNVTDICQGQLVSATINAGIGGTGAVDTYEYSIDGGSTWLSYTSGANINTSTATGSVQIRVSRSAGTGTGCTGVGPNVIATWNVNVLPASFTVNILTSTPLCYRGNAVIEVPSSNASLTYQLRDNTTNVGSAQVGDGGTLTFMTNTLTATNANYNILATNNTTSCTTSVSAGTISVSPAPSGYATDGEVRTCYVNSADYVEFSTGSGIMLAINSNGQNLGDVTVTEYAGAPVNVQACGTYQPWYVTATLGRHWKIEPTTQPLNPVSVRLYFDNSDYLALQAVANANANPNDDINAIGSLDLSKYSNLTNPSVVNGTFNDNCSGGSSTVHLQAGSGNINSVAGLSGFTGSGLYTAYSFTGFSELWLSGTDNVSPLPIELTSFTAVCNDGKVELNWVTATEINNEKFVIERSADLQAWEEVLVQAGAGNSNQSLNYSGVDVRPLNGLSYYRLTQYDYDGASETFEPISITCYTDEDGNTIMVYPNPATDHYTVSIFVANDINEANIQLNDMSGKLLNSNNVKLVKGSNEFTYNIQIKPGTYILRVISSQIELKPLKLIVR